MRRKPKMKRCPNCQRRYPDTADICIYDGEKLIPIASSESSGETSVAASIQGHYDFLSEPVLEPRAVRPTGVGHERFIVRQTHTRNVTAPRNTVPDISAGNENAVPNNNRFASRREFIESLGGTTENRTAEQTARESIFGPHAAQSDTNRTRHFQRAHPEGGSAAVYLETAIRYSIPTIFIISCIVAVITNWETIQNTLLTFMVFWIPSFLLSLFITRRNFNIQIGTLLVLSAILALIFIILYYNVAGISSGIMAIISPLVPILVIIAMLFFMLRTK